MVSLFEGGEKQRVLDECFGRVIEIHCGEERLRSEREGSFWWREFSEGTVYYPSERQFDESGGQRVRKAEGRIYFGLKSRGLREHAWFSLRLPRESQRGSNEFGVEWDLAEAANSYAEFDGPFGSGPEIANLFLPGEGWPAKASAEQETLLLAVLRDYLRVKGWRPQLSDLRGLSLDRWCEGYSGFERQLDFYVLSWNGRS